MAPSMRLTAVLSMLGAHGVAGYDGKCKITLTDSCDGNGADRREFHDSDQEDYLYAYEHRTKSVMIEGYDETCRIILYDFHAKCQRYNFESEGCKAEVVVKKGLTSLCDIYPEGFARFYKVEVDYPKENVCFYQVSEHDCFHEAQEMNGRDWGEFISWDRQITSVRIFGARGCGLGYAESPMPGGRTPVLWHNTTDQGFTNFGCGQHHIEPHYAETVVPMYEWERQTCRFQEWDLAACMFLARPLQEEDGPDRYDHMCPNDKKVRGVQDHCEADECKVGFEVFWKHPINCYQYCNYHGMGCHNGYTVEKHMAAADDFACPGDEYWRDCHSAFHPNDDEQNEWIVCNCNPHDPGHEKPNVTAAAKKCHDILEQYVHCQVVRDDDSYENVKGGMKTYYDRLYDLVPGLAPLPAPKCKMIPKAIAEEINAVKCGDSKNETYRRV